MMRKYSLLAVVAPLLLSACYDDHNGYGGYNGYSGPSANFQVQHASPDAPALIVLVDGQQWFDELHYGEGTGELQIPAGSHTVSIQAQTPSGPVTVIAPATVNIAQNNDYVVVAEGPYASISASTYTHALSTVAPTATRLQFVHAAPAQPALAVYLTAPAANLSSSAPLGSGSLAFMGAIGPNDVPSGAYEIRITPAGATTPVLFDSGTITLTGGADFVVTLLQNVGPGTAPIVLGTFDSNGDNSTLFDVSTPATVRVVNASPDAPALDVSAINSSSLAFEIGAQLAYEGFTSYEPLAPSNYTIQFSPASNVNQIVTSLPLTLNAGSQQTLYALGPYASIGTQVTWDDRRRIATGAKLRIFQALPDVPFVDIYLTAPGAGIASTAPTFAAVPFTGDTGFQQFAAGSYDLTITAAGTQNILIGPTTLNVINTGIYTAVARDAPGGGAPGGLILMDDFAP
jgi:hypothetical protein